ncbi:MAG: hypothetical protein IE926_09845, partial [Micrococcales bacterium]|nr:hypothetical protein [Micrococcales bacterium]
MTSPDRRSVGELLADCDRATRELLHDPLDLNSAALIQAWPEVVQAAHDLLDILPTPPTPPGRSPQVAAAGSDVTGERLHLISAAVHNRLHGAPWPGTCPADERLVAVADDLVRAHDLIHRRWRDTAPLTPEVLADAAAARTRVLHSVYVTTHAVRLAVTRALQDKPSGPRSRARVAIHRSAALRDTAARLDTAERIAGT